MSAPRILVAEDEAPQRDALVRALKTAWPRAEVVATCEDGFDALEAFEREAPDVAFLDIRMPACSGIEVARAIAGRAHVVFVTAFDDHAVQAFEQGAIDYLLKPVQIGRLAETVRRLEARLAQPPRDLEGALGTLPRESASAPLKWITASVGATVALYPIEEVLGFHAREKYTTVLSARGDAEIRMSLKELVQKLDADEFWQVHRSVVVRVAAIDRVRRDEAGKLQLTLRGRDEMLPVSDAFRGRFRGM